VIPHLKDLLFAGCGYRVPPGFTTAFVTLHDKDWGAAQGDWEQFVKLVLDSDVVDSDANGDRAMKQAVEGAAAFLVEPELWPWCPMCLRGTESRSRGEEINAS
jgi:hypothetical protein